MLGDCCALADLPGMGYPGVIDSPSEAFGEHGRLAPLPSSHRTSCLVGSRWARLRGGRKSSRLNPLPQVSEFPVAAYGAPTKGKRQERRDFRRSHKVHWHAVAAEAAPTGELALSRVGIS